MDVLVWALRNGQHSCVARLFSNDYQPDVNTTRTNLLELVGAGYGPNSLGNPTNLGIDITGRDVWLFPEVVWTATGIGLPVIAYGYWIDFLDPLTGGTRILQVQKFFQPQAFIAAGNQIRFTPSWGGKQC